MHSEIATLRVSSDCTNWEPGTYAIVIHNYFYSFGEWHETPYTTTETIKITGSANKAKTAKVKIKTASISIKKGKSKNLSYTPKKGVTLKKVSGNKKISVSSKGKVKVNKQLKPGNYKIKVKAYKQKKVVASKTVIVKVK